MNGLSADDASYIDPNELINLYDYLKNLENEDLQQIFMRAVQARRLKPREELYAQDTPIEYVYVLIEGAIRQERTERTRSGAAQQRLVRNEDQPGALLGIYDFLFGKSHRTRARAANKPCLVYAIEAAALNRLIFRYPDVRQWLIPSRLSRLRTMPVIGPLEPVALGFLADATTECFFSAGQRIYASGDSDERIYLINRGQVSVEWDDGRMDWLGNGAVFGLLDPAQRARGGPRVMTSTAKAETETSVYSMSYAQFVGITGIEPDQQGQAAQAQREETLANLHIFRDFDEAERHRLAGFVSHDYLPTNHLLIIQGEEANSLWILMAGGRSSIHALDADGNKLITTTSQGPTYFGETALLGQFPQDSSVEAVAGSEWLRLHRDDFAAFDATEADDMAGKLMIRTKQRKVITSKKHRARYPWLQPGELLVVFSRRHWISYLYKALPSIILLALLIIVTIIGATIPGRQRWIAIPLGILTILALAAFIWGLVDYFNDWIIVTNRRVVQQEKVLFINEWRKEAPLEEIQNVNFVATFLGRWLNYGTMIVETASTHGVIRFDYLNNFGRLREAIYTYRDQRRRHAAAQSKMTIHRVLEGRLGLVLDLPERVCTSVPTVETPDTWRDWVSARVRRRMRREEGNRVIWRKHWAVLIPRLWLALLTLLFWIVLTILPMFTSLWGYSEQVREVSRFIQIVGSLLTLVALARVTWVVANWRNDTYEVNDTQIVHVEKLPFSLVENKKSAELEDIQNVEMRVPTPLHWLLNYGEVRCQTAAESGAFVFRAVPDPRAVAAEIDARRDRFKLREQGEEAQRRAKELPDWFEIYNTLGLEEVERTYGPTRRSATNEL